MTNNRKMPSRKVIKQYWANELVKKGKFDSIEELYEADYCFACGSIDDKEGDSADTQYTVRAHIQARVTGKTEQEKIALDAVENIHLLCEPCHKLSEFRMGADYWDWFAKQDALQMMMSAVMRERPDLAQYLLKMAQNERVNE